MTGVGIIGMGSISESHIRAYRQFDGCCRIAALYDRKLEKALEKKKAFHLEAEIYADYRELLKNPEVQLVSICLPPYLHAGVAVECMRAGKHVLLEKPMAPSLEECDRMLTEQKRAGCYLGVISQNRYRKENLFLKRMVESGVAGPVLSGEVRSCWYRGNAYYAPAWRGNWETEGGGCLLNHAIHQIDLLDWILGKPCEVYAVMKNLAHPGSEVEDMAAAILRYPSGAVITLEVSLVSHGEKQSIVLQGTEAALSAPFSVECSRENETGFPEENRELKDRLIREYQSMEEPPFSGFAGQIDAVLSALESGKTCGVTKADGRDAAGVATVQKIWERCGVTGEDGRDAIEVVTALYESAVTGTAVKLPSGIQSGFYSRDGRLMRLKEKTL